MSHRSINNHSRRSLDTSDEYFAYSRAKHTSETRSGQTDGNFLGTMARSNMADAHARDSLRAQRLLRVRSEYREKMINYHRDVSINASPTIVRDFRSALATRGSLWRGNREKYDTIELRIRTNALQCGALQNQDCACAYPTCALSMFSLH